MTKIYVEKETIEKAYNEHKHIVKAAESIGIGKNTFARLMKEHGIASVGSQGARRISFNEHYFDVIDTEDKAYWLGFIYADGCVYKGSDAHSYRLQINLQEQDFEHLNKFQSSIGSNYKLTHNKSTNSYSLKINSTIMCKALMKHGVHINKSLTVLPPNLKDELIHHFIRGVFDGDGSVSINRGRVPRFDMISASFEFIEWLHKYVGLGSTLVCTKKSKHELYSFRISAYDDFISVHEYMYDDATVWLDRKYEKYFDILHVIDSR